MRKSEREWEKERECVLEIGTRVLFLCKEMCLCEIVRRRERQCTVSFGYSEAKV